jgi:hypothetical protein
VRERPGTDVSGERRARCAAVREKKAADDRDEHELRERSDREDRPTHGQRQKRDEADGHR